MKALTVSKIGGNIAESPEKLDAFCKQFAASPSPKILVHGLNLFQHLFLSSQPTEQWVQSSVPKSRRSSVWSRI